jgi:hypothetical protein
LYRAHDDFVDDVGAFKKLRRFLGKELERKNERLVLRGMFDGFPAAKDEGADDGDASR